MLIIPLHKPLNRQTFPLITAALIVVNVLVFALLQSGDEGVRERALAYYQQTKLHKIEFPAYLQWLPDERRSELDDNLSLREPARSYELFAALQTDEEFLQALRAGQVITAEHDQFTRWKRDRGEFDRQWEGAVTDRWLMRYGEIEPVRMFSAMFLHGGWDHLIGNMVFLGILGLLVEGTLGAGLFLGVYLLAGMGGQLFGLYWRWDEVGGMLGASGAIAGLMGAFCVLWGMRRVRFFYWFWVVFDYARVPALWMLVPWLGWELSSMVFDSEAGIGFDAHAGGMVAGALLAVGVRRLGWQRDAFMDEELQREAGAQARELAADLLGRLEYAQAFAAYQQLALQHPDDADIAIGCYRAARYAPGADIDRSAAAVLALRGSPKVLEQQLTVWQDYMQAKQQRPRVPPSVLISFIARLIDGGQLELGERLLNALLRLSKPPPAIAQLALALIRSPLASKQQRMRWLTWLQEQQLDSAAAEKARLIAQLEQHSD